MISIPDPHVHTRFCGHGSGAVTDMVRSAAAKGLPGVGFAEHFPYPAGFRHEIDDAVTPSDRWQAYVNDVLQAKQDFSGRIEVLLGAEADFIPEHASSIRDRLAQAPYDCVFGSVHLVRDVLIDYSESYLKDRLAALGGVRGLWAAYWDRVEQMVRSGFCDVVAHLDLPKKFKLSGPSPKDMERVGSILESIKAGDMTLEVNTGGIDRSDAGEPYPSFSILKTAAEMQVDVLLGSDAHRPEEVGRHFHSTLTTLKALGFTQLAVYRSRRKSYIAI